MKEARARSGRVGKGASRDSANLRSLSSRLCHTVRPRRLTAWAKPPEAGGAMSPVAGDFAHPTTRSSLDDTFRGSADSGPAPVRECEILGRSHLDEARGRTLELAGLVALGSLVEGRW